MTRKLRADSHRGGSRWRLLETGPSEAFYNMALDEAIMEARRDGSVPPTLRLYGWDPPAVSIGYFQRLEEEVRTGTCENLGIDVVRRITGGGAVLHDKEVTYSLVASENGDSVPPDLVSSYRTLCGGILEGLRALGIPAELSGNDIVVGSRKISGNAQKRSYGVVLQHGSIFLETDNTKLQETLNLDGEKMNRGDTCMLDGRMTSLKEATGKSVSFRTASGHLVRGFEEALGIELVWERPSKGEVERALHLARDKYASPEWNGRT